MKETRVNRENRQVYKAVLSKPQTHKTFAVMGTNTIGKGNPTTEITESDLVA